MNGTKRPHPAPHRIIETFIRILLAGSVCGILAAFVVFGHRKLEHFALYRAMKAPADRFSGDCFRGSRMRWTPTTTAGWRFFSASSRV